MLRQWRTTADLSPLPHGGGRRAILSPWQRERLRRKVRERADSSLAELRDYLRDEEHVKVHVSTICRALRQSDLLGKKVPSGRRAQQLQAWLVLVAGARSQSAPLPFIDEAGINLAMTRLYGRAPCGERVSE